MENTVLHIGQRMGTGGLIAGLTLLIIAVQVGVDVYMGGEAEYFNAHATLLQLTAWLHGRTPDVPMIAGQGQLGGWALPLAGAVLFGAPLLVATLTVKVGQWILWR